MTKITLKMFEERNSAPTCLLGSVLEHSFDDASAVHALTMVCTKMTSDKIPV
jgi:hypothetical protein